MIITRITIKDGKSRVELIPPQAILGEGYALAHGSAKYSSRAWRTDGRTPEDALGAAMRHILKHLDGELMDSESGLAHLYHARAQLAIAIDLGSDYGIYTTQDGKV